MAKTQELIKLQGLIGHNIYNRESYPLIPLKYDTIYYAIDEYNVLNRVRNRPLSFNPQPTYYKGSFHEVGKKNQALSKTFSTRGMILFETLEDAFNGISFLLDDEIRSNQDSIQRLQDNIKDIEEFRKEHRL